MRNLVQPLRTWLGLVDAFGVGVALLGWLALRGFGARVRAAGAAAGAALLVVAFAALLQRVDSIGSGLTVALEIDDADGRRAFDVLLLLAGLGLGVAAAFAARSRVLGRDGVAAEPEPGDVPELDVVVDDDHVEDDTESVGSPSASASAVAWLDLLLVAVALALPAVLFLPPADLDFFRFASGGDVTGLVVCAHLLGGLLLGGALLAALPADDADLRWPAAAFGLVAVGAGLMSAWPRTFANEFWTMFATGLAVGLLVVAGLGLLARAVVADRNAMAVGVLVVVALLAVNGVVSGRLAVESVSRSRIGPIDIDVPDVVIPSFDIPSFDIPSFPVPSFPVFPTP